MKLRKGARILLWSGGILVAALAALYLLRWPLFGGLIRSKMAELARKELRADLQVEDLGGSLLWSIHARRAVLKPRPGAPFRSAEVERIDVDYGFLGSGEFSITVDGARFVLASKEGPTPPVHETVRDVVSVLRSLRFPGAVSATRVEAVLPDGRSVTLDRGSLDHGGWKVSLQTAGFGTLQGAATLRPDGALTFDGSASDGKVRSAKLELGPGDQCPLRISADVDGHALTWAGTASFSKGRLDRVDGELQVKEGRARTRADFVTGRVEADVDAVLALDEEDFRGDVAVTARAEGPMAGPGEAWTLREGRVRTKNARYRHLVIDEADVTLGSGSLAKVSFEARVRGGEDQVHAKGDFGWNGKPEVDARIDVSAADAAPYLALLKEPLPLKARAVHAEGTLKIREGAPSYDGSLSIGAGEYHGNAWEQARFQGSVGPDAIVAREVVVTNSPFASSMTVSGKLEGETLSLNFSSDRDRGELEGRLHKATGDFEGRVRLEGPMTWLDRGFRIQLPEEFNPLRLEGTLKHEKEDTAVRVDVTGKEGCSITVSATLRKKEDDWIVAVAPGALTLPTRKVTYDAFVFSLTDGKASLDNLKLSCSEPSLAARVSGSATWDQKERKVLFRMQDTVVNGVPIDSLFARVTINAASKEADVNLRWGKEDGDHFHVVGRWGKEIDLSVKLRAGDLKRPLVRHFLPSPELQGSVAADAHVTGSAQEPQVSGTISLMKISTAGLPPITLVIPLQSAKNGLRFWAVEEKTPYGSLTIDGTVPLPGSEAPLDLSLQLLADDLSPFLDRLTPQARLWIPRGGLAVNVGLRGPASKPVLTGRAEFSALRWKPPPPLAEAENIRVSARLDADGIAFDMVDGLLGQGPFWASGRWDAFRPGTPLFLWITGRDALAVSDPLARLRVKPDVTLTWTQGDYVRLSGRVEIPLAIYHREFAAATPGGTRVVTRQVTPPRLRLIPGESGGFLIPGIEGLEGLELDLRFVTTGEFRIENSVAGVLLHAEGQLGGTAAEPSLSGVIRSLPRHGEVKLAPGNFLRIDFAEAVLPEELGRVPTVRFEGSVGVGEGTIQVRVEGPLDNPALTLKSDPPQPQKDLLGKLAFGLGTGSFSGETGVATLAVYIYSQAQDDWPTADRKEGILDRFRPQVVAPYDQTRRKPWELPPQGTLRSTALRTEYVLNTYFSIIAETNREGDVGGDLKLRIRF